MEIKQIKEIKKGEFFRVVNRAGICDKVYVRDYYERSDKKYYAYAYYDINDFRAFKPTQKVAVGFEF